jgi:hypothetical protein
VSILVINLRGLFHRTVPGTIVSLWKVPRSDCGSPMRKLVALVLASGCLRVTTERTRTRVSQYSNHTVRDPLVLKRTSLLVLKDRFESSGVSSLHRGFRSKTHTIPPDGR